MQAASKRAKKLCHFETWSRPRSMQIMAYYMARSDANLIRGFLTTYVPSMQVHVSTNITQNRFSIQYWPDRYVVISYFVSLIQLSGGACGLSNLDSACSIMYCHDRPNMSSGNPPGIAAIAYLLNQPLQIYQLVRLGHKALHSCRSCPRNGLLCDVCTDGYYNRGRQAHRGTFAR
jgi:hypothetical protein